MNLQFTSYSQIVVLCQLSYISHNLMTGFEPATPKHRLQILSLLHFHSAILKKGAGFEPAKRLTAVFGSQLNLQVKLNITRPYPSATDHAMVLYRNTQQDLLGVKQTGFEPVSSELQSDA